GLYASIDGGSNWRKASPGLTATQFYSLDVSQTGPFLMVGSTQDEGILRSRGTAVWEDTRAGNEGGFVTIDPSDSHHVFARPWSTGLRRSDDLGESWTTLEDGLRVRYRGITSEPAYIRGFAVKPDNGKVLVAAGAVSVTQGEKKTEVYHRGCIFRSTDRGDTWSRRKLAPGDGRSVAFAPSNPKVCYAGMANGRVFRSVDAGTTWTLRQRGTTLLTSDPVNGIAVDVGDARVVYVCLGGSSSIRVMRSRDSGRTWTDISGAATGRALPTVSCNSLVQDPDHPEVLYVATDIGVFRSGDSGGSWVSFNEGSGSGNLPRVVVTRLIIQRRLRLLFASTIGRGVWRIRI
ncbi:MAG TPA: sialidase family protein, partial [Thermoflexales bacterium]|nr:sialidase family protein [Thermoflexales bacterium]